MYMGTWMYHRKQQPLTPDTLHQRTCTDPIPHIRLGHAACLKHAQFFHLSLTTFPFIPIQYYIRRGRPSASLFFGSRSNIPAPRDFYNVRPPSRQYNHDCAGPHADKRRGNMDHVVSLSRLAELIGHRRLFAFSVAFVLPPSNITPRPDPYAVRLAYALRPERLSECFCSEKFERPFVACQKFQFARQPFPFGFHGLSGCRQLQRGRETSSSKVGAGNRYPRDMPPTTYLVSYTYERRNSAAPQICNVRCILVDFRVSQHGAFGRYPNLTPTRRAKNGGGLDLGTANRKRTTPRKRSVIIGANLHSSSRDVQDFHAAALAVECCTNAKRKEQNNNNNPPAKCEAPNSSPNPKRTRLSPPRQNRTPCKYPIQTIHADVNRTGRLAQ
ncbi:hypothetical protein ACRALDRAFT_1094926 [Sodiomyces alcalophilus JCM 7366]|uniref:uncharacterized protein n=1 Tax=Sodiomyces alcalophilus JCM 7366 TaxID=591952 RepID=UPI0039B66300